MKNNNIDQKLALNSNQEEQYDRAFKKVQKMKGFYIHLIVYVLVNIGLLLMPTKYFDKTEPNFWSWPALNSTFFWGIGLICHGVSVFAKDFFLGKDWEKRKLDEFIKEEEIKKQQWK